MTKNEDFARIEDWAVMFIGADKWQRFLVGVEYDDDGDMVRLFEWRKVAE